MENILIYILGGDTKPVIHVQYNNIRKQVTSSTSTL